jgi:hypothetical protein
MKHKTKMADILLVQMLIIQEKNMQDNEYTKKKRDFT